MRIAVATEDDIKSIVDVFNIINVVQSGFMPSNKPGVPDEDEFFDRHSGSDCIQVLRRILDAEEKGSAFRAIDNLVALLDPINEVIDPSADHLKLHPKIEKCAKERDELLAALKGLVDVSKLAAGVGMLGMSIPDGADGPLPAAIALINKLEGGAQ